MFVPHISAKTSIKRWYLKPALLNIPFHTPPVFSSFNTPKIKESNFTVRSSEIFWRYLPALTTEIM